MMINGHESDEKEKLEVIDAKKSFQDIYQDESFSDVLTESLKLADILLIPQDTYSGFENCLFPEQTDVFYGFLKAEASKHNLVVDLAVSDEDYKELELHSEIISIAEILIQWIAFPIVINLISSYLYDILRQRKKNLNTNIKISVEHKGKTKTIKYEGNIENFERAMKSINENIFR